MKIARIYQPSPLQTGAQVELSSESTHHVVNVLRMRPSAEMRLFNGRENACYTAHLVRIQKKSAWVQIGQRHTTNNESPLKLHLGQVISRGDRMDFTLQKSVELGVQVITPLFSERCGVKLSGDRLLKKQATWQKIVIGACEQSGRNLVPQVMPAIALTDWCAEPNVTSLKLTLHPQATMGINQIQQPASCIRLLIGSEGGLSEAEIQTTREYGFQEILLGPRILRTETAALTAISALQLRFGDLGQ